MKNVKNKLRVIHFPQIGSCKESFKIEVENEQQAYFAINLIVNQHLWLFENRLIPDYSNAIFVEMYEDNEWVNYWNEEECMEWEEIEELISS